MDDYNKLIMDKLDVEEGDLYLYYLSWFKEDYFVVGDGHWLVMFNEERVMETAFPPNSYDHYYGKEGFTI